MARWIGLRWRPSKWNGPTSARVSFRRKATGVPVGERLGRGPRTSAHRHSRQLLRPRRPFAPDRSTAREDRAGVRASAPSQRTVYQRHNRAPGRGPHGRRRRAFPLSVGGTSAEWIPPAVLLSPRGLSLRSRLLANLGSAPRSRPALLCAAPTRPRRGASAVVHRGDGRGAFGDPAGLPAQGTVSLGGLLQRGIGGFRNGAATPRLWRSSRSPGCDRSFREECSIAMAPQDRPVVGYGAGPRAGGPATSSSSIFVAVPSITPTD